MPRISGLPMPKKAPPVSGVDRSTTTSPFTRTTAAPTLVRPKVHSPVVSGTNVPVTAAPKWLREIPGAGSSIHSSCSRSIGWLAVWPSGP